MTADPDRRGDPAPATDQVAADLLGDDQPVDGARDAPEDATPDSGLPQSLPLPVTGNDTVDEALARLAAVEGLPTDEHVEVYEDVQGRLQRALADLDGR